jgi:hypothetical protein
VLIDFVSASNGVGVEMKLRGLWREIDRERVGETKREIERYWAEERKRESDRKVDNYKRR